MKGRGWSRNGKWLFRLHAPCSALGVLLRGRLRSRLARRGIGLSAVLGATALTTTAGQAAPAGLEKMTIDVILGGTAVHSAGASALARKVSTTMLLTHGKLTAALLFLGGVLALGVGLAARPSVAEDQPKQESRAAGLTVPAERPKAGFDRHGDPLPAGALLRIGTLRYRTGGGTNQALLSPDGKWLAVAGDRMIRVWEVATGTELLCFNGHEAQAVGAAFGPDGRTVLSSSSDMTALLWNLRPVPERQRKPDELWAELAGEPVSAYRALWALVDDPKTCCALLGRRISPVKDTANIAIVNRLVAQLDSEDFQQREAASRKLAALGAPIAEQLRNALKKAESAESRRRLKDLLGRLQDGPTADDLRQLRAVHALELCGTAEARQLLQALAGGAKGAGLTRDARAALERMEKK